MPQVDTGKRDGGIILAYEELHRLSKFQGRFIYVRCLEWGEQNSQLSLHLKFAFDRARSQLSRRLRGKTP